MNFNAVAHFLLLTVASSDAAFLRSGAEDAAAAAAAGVCSDGQIYVVNNCGATLKHGDVKGTKTIQSGCQDLSGPGQRIWVGSDDSTVYSQHITLFEYSYWSPGHNGDFQLSWDVSLLTGYNYPVKVENNGQTLLDVTGPSCGGVREGLFPCSQKANACVENSYKWQPICAGCNSSCCDTSDKEHDCNPPDIDNTQNMVLTFCPNEPTNHLFAIQPATTPAPSPSSPEAEQTYCGCPQCTQAVWDTLACDDALGGCHTCGSRMAWLESNNGGNIDNACHIVASQFPSGPCEVCNPDTCNNTAGPTKSPSLPPTPEPAPLSSDHNNKCGGAINFSNDPKHECLTNLWEPTDDTTMHCLAYGGSSDPCSLNNHNDVNDGLDKDPSLCLGDTFYLWDEPDTQGHDYTWAGEKWLLYSQRFAYELEHMKSRGTKVTSPLVRAGDSGVIKSNIQAFFDACGSACSDQSDPAYIDVIAINGFCGPWNFEGVGSTGCRGGAEFLYGEAVSTAKAFNTLPVYFTNWSRLQTHSPDDQVNAMEAVDAFFPTPDSVVKRVYWFGAKDYGGGAETSGYLTNTLSDGRTLGQVWHSKCDSI